MDTKVRPQGPTKRQRATTEEPLDPALTSSPYRWALPQDEALADPELLRLSFHAESVVLTDFADEDYVTTRLVAALDVAKALATELDTSTGVLPGDDQAWNTLWHARTVGGLNLGLYVPPAVRTILLSRDWEHSDELHLPWPPLMFVCLPGRAPHVFACKARPAAEGDQLYCCPSYNVFDSGAVCVGSAAFPANPALVPAAFFASRFSRAMDTARGKSKRWPDDIGRAWAELEGQAAYPLDDLEPALRVRDAVQLGA